MARSLRDLAQWTKESDWPRVLCPVCATGTLGPKQLISQLDANSRRSVDLARRNAGPWEELSGTFVGVLQCDYGRCAQEVAVAGPYAYAWDIDDFDGYGNPSLESTYRVEFVRPELPIMRVLPRTPEAVKAEIASAGQLVFLAPSAAGNRLRRAVEELMDAHRIRKTKTDKKTGAKSPASPHARIRDFAVAHPRESDVLLAVKWIGDEATHGRELWLDDVMMCAEVLEAALVSLYDRSDVEFRALVRKINRQKGVGRRST